MKKTALLLVLFAWTCFQLVYAGSITIINQNPNYAYSGQLIATNNPSAPADANASYSMLPWRLWAAPAVPLPIPIRPWCPDPLDR